MDAASATKVQHVNKKSSDQLLTKFAELDDESPPPTAARKELMRVAKRRKRNGRTRREGDQCDSPSNNGGGASLVERKWLLPPATRKSALLRQLGIGRTSQLRARDVRKKSLLCTIEKTWRRTVEGASKVFIEKHYNRHRRLINDAV